MKKSCIAVRDILIHVLKITRCWGTVRYLMGLKGNSSCLLEGKEALLILADRIRLWVTSTKLDLV